MSFLEREIVTELSGGIRCVEPSGAADFNDMFSSDLDIPELESVR